MAFFPENLYCLESCQAAVRHPFNTRGGVTAIDDQGSQCGFICHKVIEKKKFQWLVYQCCCGDVTVMPLLHKPLLMPWVTDTVFVPRAAVVAP